MFRFLPWQREKSKFFLQALLTMGLLEATRSGFFAGFMPFFGPEKLGLPLTSVAFAFTINHFFDIFFKPIGGVVAQKFGFGRTILLASVGGFATLIATIALKSEWTLWFFSGLWGILASPLYPGISTLASRIAVAGKESRALTFTTVLITPWYGLGIVASGQIASKDADTAAYLLLSTSVLAFLISLFLTHLRLPPEPFTAKKQTVPWTTLLTFIPAAFGQTFGPGLVSLLILRYAKLFLHIDPITVGFFGFLSGSLAVTLLPFLSRWVDRRSYVWPLIGGPSLLGLAMFLLSFAEGYTHLTLISVMAGIGFSLMMSGWNGYLARNLPQSNRAAFWGIIMTIEGLGVAVGPTVGSYLWDVLGPKSPFLAGGLILLSVSMFYAYLFLRGSKK